MKYQSKFACQKCGQPEIYDADTQTISCQCGTFKAKFVNLQAFMHLPEHGQKTLSDLTDIEVYCFSEKRKF